MNHFGHNSNSPIDEAASSGSSSEVDQIDVTPQLQPDEESPAAASSETSEERRARINKVGFVVFFGSFMIYMFVQAVFFPSGGTAPT